MKAFETPFVDVKKFDVEDVLTASGGAPAETEEEVPPFMGSNCVSVP